MYRRLSLDLPRLPLLVGRGLSDRAIGRILGCSRETILNYRWRLGITSPWGLTPNAATRRATVRARHAQLDRLWARLSVAEKTARLLMVGNPEVELKGGKHDPALLGKSDRFHSRHHPSPLSVV